MKRAFALLLVLVMCLPLGACGSKEAPGNVQTEQAETIPAVQEVPAGTTAAPETTYVPETTAAPEPVYETIEITAENLWDYFEIRYEAEFKEDSFGEPELLELSWYFNLKPEYSDKLWMGDNGVVDFDAETDGFAIELETDMMRCEPVVDWQNRTYELLPQYTERIVYTVGIINRLDYMTFLSGDGNRFMYDFASGDKKLVSAVSADLQDYTILRTKGSITLRKDT